MTKSLLQIFKNSDYGEVRTAVINGDPYFGSTDVAKALGYVTPRKAILDHCKRVLKRNVGVQTGTKSDGTPAIQHININFIPIGDVCRLAASSQLPGADKFESWIFDEVIPTVLKTGAYVTDKADPTMLREKANEIESVDTINTLAQTILPIYNASGMKPQFQLMALKQLYGKANLELPTNGVVFNKQLYDTEQIAAKLGIYSKGGKPHGQAVYAIISRIKLDEEEHELVPYTRNGHSGTTYQYTANVIEKVRKWLMENGYPTEIKSCTSARKYSVAYETGARA